MSNSNDNSPKTNILRFPPQSEQAINDEIEMERRKELFSILDKLRDNIVNDKMDDVIIVAKNIENGLFFTHASIRQSTYKSSDITAIGAMLNAIVIDLNTIFTDLNCSDIDGNILEPYMEVEDIL